MKSMVTRLVTVLFVLMSVMPPSAMAYNLGEGSVESAYQQPLRIKFELGKEQVLFDTELSVGLASKEIFAAQNLEYLPVFDELVFRIESSDSVPSHLILESPSVVSLNELSLLLRLSWKKTSLLTRVDVILNANFSGVISIVVNDKGEVGPYQVTLGDTLWRVAKIMRNDKVSIWQVMDAIYVKNPEVFLDQNPEKLIIGSWVEKPSEQFIAEQTGTLVELMIKGVAATNIETSDLFEVPHTEELELDEEVVDSDFVEFSEVSEIPYFDASDIAAEAELPKTSLVVDEGTVELSSAAVEINMPKPDSVDSELSQVKTDLIKAQDNIMSAQIEASTLRAQVELLQSQLNGLKQQLSDERVAKQNAFEAVDRLQARSVSLPDNKFILIGTAIMIIVLLSASIFYYLRRRTPRNDAPSEAGDSGSVAIAFASDDVFAEAKEATSDVFDANVNEIDFPGLDELKHVANTEHVLMDDMDYLNQSDNINPVDVKLDLAQTYADLGDISGAVEVLEEIIGESNKEGKARAQAVLDKLNSAS